MERCPEKYWTEDKPKVWERTLQGEETAWTVMEQCRRRSTSKIQEHLLYCGREKGKKRMHLRIMQSKLVYMKHQVLFHSFYSMFHKTNGKHDLGLNNKLFYSFISTFWKRTCFIWTKKSCTLCILGYSCHCNHNSLHHIKSLRCIIKWKLTKIKNITSQRR